MRGGKGIPRNDWTDAEFDELRTLLDKGYSVESIAKIVGRTPRAVDEKRKQHGLRDQTKRFRSKSETRYERRPGVEVTFTPRPCMCCERVFQSEGIHNRLCGDCRRRDEGISSHAVATGRPSRGVRV